MRGRYGSCPSTARSTRRTGRRPPDRRDDRLRGVGAAHLGAAARTRRWQRWREKARAINPPVDLDVTRERITTLGLTHAAEQLATWLAGADEILDRLENVHQFSVLLPRTFREGDAVRRRQIIHAICANPTVTDRKALYKANEPWSFFENAGLIRSWCAIADDVRTWLRANPDFYMPEIDWPSAGDDNKARIIKTAKVGPDASCPPSLL